MALPARPYVLALKHSVKPHVSSLIENMLVLPLCLVLCQVHLVTLTETTAERVFCAFTPKCALFWASHFKPEAAECVGDGEAPVRLDEVSSPH